MNSAFEQNVRRALSVLANFRTVPSPLGGISAFPQQIRHLGIVVLREAASIELDRRDARSRVERAREARRKALADPEVRKRMSEARRKQWADPEVRKNRRRIALARMRRGWRTA